MARRPPPPGDDDTLAFRRAVADVRPLPSRPQPSPRAGLQPTARAARARRHDVLVEATAAAQDAAGTTRGDAMSFRRATVREDTLRKLRRGQFAVEAEIDLHGLTRHAAHDALRQFLNECVLRGLRCIRVIHGKGLRSGPAGPVLKEGVDHWLRQLDNVAAFASARPVDGGTGALYVLLRR
jgi:DNA-nicking Smr family endonuclease